MVLLIHQNAAESYSTCVIIPKGVGEGDFREHGRKEKLGKTRNVLNHHGDLLS